MDLPTSLKRNRSKRTISRFRGNSILGSRNGIKLSPPATASGLSSQEGGGERGDASREGEEPLLSVSGRPRIRTKLPLRANGWAQRKTTATGRIRNTAEKGGEGGDLELQAKKIKDNEEDSSNGDTQSRERRGKEKGRQKRENKLHMNAENRF